ncbi:hypothetical protein MLD38_024981 [Melastoma candidum]|uniref:Uncharacterized protein n=1 Tax=Melastoma candidum TaxID=119954 RepID=A0ACB9NVA8_9MYRT|nr:hypothetical protein MLD38_024981 [Melastoma candidum]
MKGKGVFDLEKHFAFYGAYHSNPINILVHTIFVWPIFFTALVPLYFTPSLCELLSLEPQCFLAARGLFLNLGFFVALVYAGFYVLMDRRAGFLAGLLCMACWVGSSLLARHLGPSLAWKVVLAAQILCWTGQFLGHGLFEKRAPALLDNLVQAFLMAPFFVLLEVLHIVFGYEPYPGFHSTVKQKVDAEIKAWQETKQKKMT